MGNHNYLLGQTLDLHSNGGERNPMGLSAWLIGGWSFYWWKFLKLLACVSPVWAAGECWWGLFWCSPCPCHSGYHRPLWQHLSPNPWSQQDHQHILPAVCRNSGQKTENRNSSQILFFLRSSSHSHIVFEFLLTGIFSKFPRQNIVYVL